MNDSDGSHYFFKKTGSGKKHIYVIAKQMNLHIFVIQRIR